MIDLVKRFLGRGEGDRTSEAEGRSGHDIRVATCALLLEISNEDYFMHKLANLLRLTHRQLIDAKLRVNGRHPKG